jgi:hypothetical protein
VFTARNRQNPFAKRRREERAAQTAEPPTPAPESSPEPPAPKPVQTAAVPFDSRTAASDGITDAPDLSTFATGGVVGQAVIGPPSEHVYGLDAPERGNIGVPVIVPHSVIDADTQAKIDAVLNGRIEPVGENHPGPRGAETMRPHGTAAAEAAESEPKRGRGRPRPQETIDRDNAVYKLLTAADADEGVSKEALALSLDEKEQQVYSSLRQLSKEGRAETRYIKGHGYRWFAV